MASTSQVWSSSIFAEVLLGGAGRDWFLESDFPPQPFPRVLDTWAARLWALWEQGPGPFPSLWFSSARYIAGSLETFSKQVKDPSLAL